MSKKYEELNSGEKDVLADYLNKLDSFSKSINKEEKADLRAINMENFNSYNSTMEQKHPFLKEAAQKYKREFDTGYLELKANGTKIDLSDLYAEMMMQNPKVKELDAEVQKAQDALKKEANSLKKLIKDDKATPEEIDAFQEKVEQNVKDLNALAEKRAFNDITLSDDDKRQVKKYQEAMFGGEDRRFEQEIYEVLDPEKGISIRVDVQEAYDTRKDLSQMEVAEVGEKYVPLEEEKINGLTQVQMDSLTTAQGQAMEILMRGNERVIARLVEKMSQSNEIESREFDFNADAFIKADEVGLTDKIAEIQDRIDKRQTKNPIIKSVRDKLNKFANKIALIRGKGVDEATIENLYNSMKTMSDMGKKMDGPSQENEKEQVIEVRKEANKQKLQKFAQNKGKLTAKEVFDQSGVGGSLNGHRGRSNSVTTTPLNKSTDKGKSRG